MHAYTHTHIYIQYGFTFFEPTKERDGTWKIKTNELNKLIRNKTIINYIKSQRLGWIGHVHRMPDERMVKKYMN